jgi:spore maturation protein CgeB
MTNLVEEGIEKAAEAFRNFRKAFPTLDVRFFRRGEFFLGHAEEELRGSDIVVIHEWNDPEIVHAILALKPRLGFRALFHDTHHRAYTNPEQIARMPLEQLDGVLAFGEAVRQIYAELFRVPKVWVFQEAADLAHFRPLLRDKDTDVIWVGNWGDEERTRELQEFLIIPSSRMRDRSVAVHGVRFPKEARAMLDEAGIEYRGYLPNLEAPQIYARSLLTLHVPRKFYANGLSGVPTIRVFEALACGVPLLCSPWTDTEGLFRPGEDYLCLPDGSAMEAEIRHLLDDEAARQQLATNGLETIRQRHTCAHRAREFLDICEELGQ